MVVEDTKAAQECVDYVRKHSLGVVSCLILDRQRHFEKVSREPVQTPEGVPRLFDLVNADDDLRTAFYFALRDTVVAKDLDQASRIAYGDGQEGRLEMRLPRLEMDLTLPLACDDSSSGNNRCSWRLCCLLSQSLFARRLAPVSIGFSLLHCAHSRSHSPPFQRHTTSPTLQALTSGSDAS